MTGSRPLRDFPVAFQPEHQRPPGRGIRRPAEDTPMNTRTLRGGTIRVSELCMGCWAMGGPFQQGGGGMGYGDVADAESVRAVRRALELGVNFFDTSDVYGCGHGERVLGEALAG